MAPAVAHAGQLVVNGDFSSRLSWWQISERVARVTADTEGNRRQGSARLYLNGGRQKGEASVSQEIAHQLKPGTQSLLSFVWKKKWSGGLPTKQSAFVQIIEPGGKAIDVWSNSDIDSADTWRSASVDLASYIKKEGTYRLRFSASFENGGGGDAGTAISFDDVALSSPSVDVDPEASVLSPTGASPLSGGVQVVYGLASDDIGVAKVEIALTRIKDGYYWDGSSWTPNESWIDAKITSGLRMKNASWSYSWALPTADGDSFRLTTKATDTNGNVEQPTSIYLAVDTVAPSGSIYMNDASSFTKNRKVKVDNQVTGATRMRFSKDGGVSWGAWKSFSNQAEFEFGAGDGNKLVTGEFSDSVGNKYRVSGSIVLDTVPPVTKMTFPSPASVNIKPGSTIGAVFYEEMNGSSFKNDGTEQGSTFFVKQGSSWVMGSAIYDNATKTAKFVPASPLADGTTYTAFLKGVEDAAGNALAADYSWSFTTSGSAQVSLNGRVTKTAGAKLLDGAGLVELTVPFDAVGFDSSISLTEVKEEEAPPLAGLARFSAIYRLGPDSLSLNKSALLRLKCRQLEGIDKTAVQIYAFDAASSQWKPAETRLDVTSNVASADIKSPTFFMVAGRVDFAPPRTSILTPTGASVLSGQMARIAGLASDDVSVAKVEVSLVRLKDGYNWNGSAWVPVETWAPAAIANQKNAKAISWSYAWSLPKPDGGRYQILARSIDGAGNRESGPAVSYVQMAGE